MNVAMLDTTIKDVNLSLKWVLKEIEIQTDSVTVHSWIHSMITNKKKVHKKGAAELITLQHLGILRKMTDEFELNLRVVFVLSNRNKADSLTRVRKYWLEVEEDTAVVCCVGQGGGERVTQFASCESGQNTVPNPKSQPR